ncbi:MAG: hypothetical protein VKJ02_17675 [Snowella sp.]|nr:hypothetical protein [Snowella sp.]
MMLQETTWPSSPSETEQRKMGLVAFLFFMMGALHIYVQLQKQKDWLCSEGFRFLKIGLAAATFAGVLEFFVLST